MPHFQLHHKSKSGIIHYSRDRDSQAPSSFNGKSMIHGVVSSNDLVVMSIVASSTDHSHMR